MPKNFLEAKSNARIDCTRFVQEPLERIFGGKIIHTEGTDDTALLLDLHGGIDAILVHPKFGLFGIGLRVQYGQNHRTFTIRKQRESQAKTEFEKHQCSLVEGGITTKFNVHAYIDRDRTKLLGAAVARTEDIYRCITNNDCYVDMTARDQIGRATFYVVAWDTFKNNSFGPIWFAEFNGKGTL